MYLELRPVSRPAQYGPEWDAYGLCDNQQWLSQSGAADEAVTRRCEVARQFLQRDPFHDRGRREFREDVVLRDGRQFIVFLLLTSTLSGDVRPQVQTISVPTPGNGL